MLSKQELQDQAKNYALDHKPNEMVTTLKQAIEEYEDPVSMFMLAKHYLNTKTNYEEANALLQKSASRNNDSALFELYKLTKNIAHLKKGSAIGSGKCSNELALHYWTKENNNVDADKYFKLAIKQNDLHALNNYGYFMLKTDAQVAVASFIEGVKRGCPIAMLGLARALTNDNEDMFDLTFLDIAPTNGAVLLKKTNLHYKIQLLEMSCAKNEIYACVDLLVIYNQIRDEELVREKSEKYLHIYKTKNIEITKELYETYLEIVGWLASYHYNHKNTDKMINCYNECIKQNMFLKMLEYSLVVSDDEMEKHIELADSGDLNECVFVSLYYRKQQNNEKLLHYLLLCGDKNPHALYFLAKYYEQHGDEKKMLNAYTSGMKFNDTRVAHELSCYWKKKNNEKLAKVYLDKYYEWGGTEIDERKKMQSTEENIKQIEKERQKEVVIQETVPQSVVTNENDEHEQSITTDV